MGERAINPPHYDEEPRVFEVTIRVKSVIVAEDAQGAECELKNNLNAGDIDEWEVEYAEEIYQWTKR